MWEFRGSVGGEGGHVTTSQSPAARSRHTSVCIDDGGIGSSASTTAAALPAAEAAPSFVTSSAPAPAPASASKKALRRLQAAGADTSAVSVSAAAVTVTAAAVAAAKASASVFSLASPSPPSSPALYAALAAAAAVEAPSGASVGGDNVAPSTDATTRAIRVSRVHSHVVTCVAVHRFADAMPLVDGAEFLHLAPGVPVDAATYYPTFEGSDGLTVISGDAGGDVIIWCGSAGGASSAKLFSLSLGGGASHSQSMSSSASASSASAAFPTSTGSPLLIRKKSAFSTANFSTANAGKPSSSRTEGVSCVAISGSFYLAGGSEGTVVIWKRRFVRKDKTSPLLELTPELIAREARAHNITRCAFLPGGCSSPHAASVFPPPRASLAALAFALTGGGEGDVRLWLPGPMAESGGGAIGGSALGPISASKVLRGHTARITALSGDLAKIVTGSLDGTIKVWDSAGGLLHTLRFPGPSSGVSSATITPHAALVGLVDGRVFWLDFAAPPAAPAETRHTAAPLAAYYDNCGSGAGGGAVGGALDMHKLRIALKGTDSAQFDDGDSEGLTPLELQRAWDSL